MKTWLSGLSPEAELVGGVGDRARLVPIVAGEDVGTGFGMYRGEGVDDDVGKDSMVIPNAVFPVGEPGGLWHSRALRRQAWGTKNCPLVVRRRRKGRKFRGGTRYLSSKSIK